MFERDMIVQRTQEYEELTKHISDYCEGKPKKFIK